MLGVALCAARTPPNVLVALTGHTGSRSTGLTAATDTPMVGPHRSAHRTFTHPNCTTPSRYPDFAALLAAQATHDPNLVFEPQLFTRIKANESYG